MKKWDELRPTESHHKPQIVPRGKKAPGSHSAVLPAADRETCQPGVGVGRVQQALRV